MEIARNWRLQKQRYTLQGSKCGHPNCEKVFFTPKGVCPDAVNHIEIKSNTPSGNVYIADTINLQPTDSSEV